MEVKKERYFEEKATRNVLSQYKECAGEFVEGVVFYAVLFVIAFAISRVAGLPLYLVCVGMCFIVMGWIVLRMQIEDEERRLRREYEKQQKEG